MGNYAKAAWSWLSDLTRHFLPIGPSLKEKAQSIAGKVNPVKDGDNSKASCPVCFNILRATNIADLRMMVAVHMSLWHPDDVKFLWHLQTRKVPSTIHYPSLIIGFGMAVGLGAFLARASKN